ncbi:MAG: photosystem I reaction center protein subunit XI [Hydrococcus sp. Prado102]|jgi:photosystem I subunit 11|nr:photosystem I reaction center protein subunit XI [Hydrococcus sp. Prado102]
MSESGYKQVVQPYNGDPFTGNLATPISASDFTNAFIGNLPAYRPGLSPLLRGLEIGMAHGYFIIGPWVVLGPLRDSEFASLGGLISGLTIVLLATACLASYGLVSFQGGRAIGSGDTALKSSDGWSQFTAGFFVGGMGGAFTAYFLLQNLGVVDGIMRGLFN